MTRIIGGRDGGRRLKAPPGLETRPTGARVRQTLFDILAPRLDGCSFLDAFAGSGAVGFEACSRGARLVVLLETRPLAVAALKENAATLGAGRDRVRIVRQDSLVAMAAMAARGERFDIVFLDPPYATDLALSSLGIVGEKGLLLSGGVAVVQHFHKTALPETIGRLVRARSKRIGDHVLSLYDGPH